MSLLKRNKDKQLAAEKKLAARHAIVKMDVDRNVRDAYFQGLVFAAVANDNQIDESERARLQEFGEALELTAEDVAEAIQGLSGMDDDAKMGVIEECARQLTNVEVAECFLKEFLELWLLGGGKQDEFGDFKSQLIDWMGDDVRVAEAEKIKAAETEEVKRKAEEAQEKELQRQRKIEAERKAEEARRAADADRVLKELRRTKEESRRSNGYKTFGVDVIRVVRELSLFDKESVDISELNLLREGLLDEGYGIVASLLPSNEVLRKIIDSEVKMSMEHFEGRSRFFRPSQIAIETESFRRHLKREVSWITNAWLVLIKGVSDEVVKEVNELLAPKNFSEVCGEQVEVAPGLMGLFGLK